jgi:hypothetical protein
MAAVRQDQGLHQKAAALECLARRYKELPPPVINEPELSRLVQAIATFVNIMHETEAERSKGAQEIASNWLVELCQALATEPGSYGLLARDIRLLMQSEAVGFAWHNPTFEQAAKKMLVQAVPSLRQQGRFMEALDLAHAFEQAADSEIWAHLQAPKAVSDFLLVVEALYPAERRTLLQMLEQQTEELAETLPAPIDTTKAGTS